MVICLLPVAFLVLLAAPTGTPFVPADIAVSLADGPFFFPAGTGTGQRVLKHTNSPFPMNNQPFAVIEIVPESDDCPGV